MIPMDFQKATADRIVEVFRSGQTRVLLADEVGLGKTIVAREVIRQVEQWHKEIGDPHFKVVYICSNINIASQNAGKLGIRDQMNVSESRLSMQHLKIYQNAGNDHDYAQLIPLTPATSFTMTSGCGNQEERALMFAHLRRLPVFRGFSSQLSTFLAYDAEKYWNWYISDYEEKVRVCDANGSHYLRDMAAALMEKFSREPDLVEDILDNMRSSDPNRRRLSRPLINRLRMIFAEISLRKLEPDLVIMDEFQRFRDLIAPADDSEEKLLSQQFLQNTSTKVLLLSATPYKPYSTLEEIAADETADHYREFMDVMEFLFYDEEKKKKFHTVWSDYSSALCEISNENLTVLLARKELAEDALYQGICRTERFNTGIIDDSGAREVPISAGDILSYDAMQTLLDTISNQSRWALRWRNVPTDYVKSAPYLLSFMENYQLKKQIRDYYKQGHDFAVECGSDVQHLLLKKSSIHNYREIPFENARLETLKEVAFSRERNGAETLLWVPPSRPYYQTGSVFDQNKDFSKVLVFSSWEMVPRMISIMLSYESERLTIGKLFHNAKFKRDRGYFATKEERRFGITRLKNESEDIICLVSDTLAKLYNPKEHMGKDIKGLRKEIKSVLQKKLSILQEKRNLPISPTAGAQALIQCIKALDGELDAHPATIPSDAAEILTDMAIASPAICAYRLLLTAWKGAFKTQIKESAQAIAKDIFVSLFNKAESSAILDLLYGSKNDDAYYQTVFRYCVDGNLQAMLDEYAHILDVDGADLQTAMTDAFVDTVNLQIDTQESFPDSEKDRPRLRTHFAVGYFNARVSDESVVRADRIRKAFNSPFRPFVLSTTSIGQEGLDFHFYCRKVMHWNLPSNPIDLEQREGRVNRFKCLAVRQNIARKYGSEPTWDDMFARAAKEEKGSNPDLVPYWCLPHVGKDMVHIERLVPMYPFSQDHLRYERIIKILSLYRLTLGQPRQEELISILDSELADQSDSKLFMNLSPFYHKIVSRE